jgi:hypothetical protein
MASPFDDIDARNTAAGGTGPAEVSPFDDIDARNRMAGGRAPGIAKGLWNAALAGLTFGFDDEIAAMAQTGFGHWGDWDAELRRMREDKRAFARAHPYLNFAGEAVGSLPTIFIPGMGGANLVQRGRQAATLGQFVKEGARTGAQYGAVAGVGNADPDTTAGAGQHVLQRALGAVGGGVVGAGLGAGLGAGAKAVNSIANAYVPGWRAASQAAEILKGGTTGEEAARMQAIRDIALELKRDQVDPTQVVQAMLPGYREGRRGTLTLEQIEQVVSGHLEGQPTAAIARALGVSDDVVARMVTRFNDEIAPRFQDSNLLDVLRTPRTPGEVVVIPNTMDLAHVAATTEGRGRQIAMQRMRQRQADTADELVTLIDDTFGSAGFDAARKVFAEETQGLARNLYKGLHQGPGTVMTVAEIGPAARDPLLAKAVEFAVRDATIQGDAAIAAAIQAGNLNPRAVDLIQRQLRLASQSLTDPNAAGLARTLRDQILAIAEQRMPAFWGTRGWYRNRMAAEEAFDLGRALGVKRGTSGDEAFAFWRRYMDEDHGLLVGAQRTVAYIQKQLKAAATEPERAALQRQLDAALIELEQLGQVVANFRAGWGQSLKDALDKGANADQFLTGAASREFRRRAVEFLGRQDGARFMAAIEAALRQKQALQILYGNSETAARLAKRSSLRSLTDAAGGVATLNPAQIARGVGEMIRGTLHEQRMSRVAEMLSVTEVRQVFQLARYLRDHMERAQLPAPRELSRVTLAVVDRLPERLREHIREALGHDVRGQDLLQALTAVLAQYTTDRTVTGSRGAVR